MTLKKKYNRLKGGLYLLLLMALPLLSLGDDKVNALFAQGNGQYAKGQYQQALRLYQQVINDGYQSAVIYFNTGNAYYKLGDMPSALLYYEKAHKLAPGDDDININIQVANSKITDKIEPQPEFFVTRWWHNFILLLSVNSLASISVLLFLAGFAVLVLYLFTGSTSVKKTSFYSGIVLICLGCVSIAIANRQVYYFNHHHQAIVFSPSVTAKSSPADAAKALFVVHEGTKVNVIQTSSDWVEVELPNGNAGWIATGDIKEI